MWVRSMGWEDPLEDKMATHSSTLVCKISWIGRPGGLLSIGSQRVGHDGAHNLTLDQMQLMAIALDSTVLTHEL